jgi:hypothetical protein
MICLIVLLAAPIPAAQAFTDVSVWGGYTTFAMDDVNKFLRDSVGAGGSVTKVNNGILAGVDVLFPVPGAPGLSLGPRAEYLSCNQGKASTASTAITEDQYLIPLMAGGRYQLLDNGSGLRLNGNLFMGIGLGYATTDVKTTAAGTATDASTSYSGSAFVMDLGVGGAYSVSPAVDIGFDLGYRLANLGAMGTGGYGGGGGSGTTGTGYGPSVGARKTSLMNPVSGSSVQYDFSGFMIHIGATFRFK